MVVSPMTACVNGKWLAQSPSGTQRYATEVMLAISASPTAPAITLVLPRDAVEPSWAAKFCVIRSRLRGTIFEQLALPWHARGKHLYSLAGPAPLLKRNQTLVMHDATPFRYPSTFRWAFVVWYHIMYTILSRTAKRTLTVSSFSRNELADVLHVPESRFELAPCGADHIGDNHLHYGAELLPFAPHSFALIVGNQAMHKNINAAVEALTHAGVPVAVVGTPQRVFRDVALKCRGDVRYLGRVDDHELEYLYGAAGVLVAPSKYEGFCIPIVEAGRLGCPSVFATGSAMSEVAGDGGYGFDPANVDACVELVQRILGDSALRKKLGSKARANSKRFCWAETASTIFAPELATPPSR